MLRSSLLLVRRRQKEGRRTYGQFSAGDCFRDHVKVLFVITQHFVLLSSSFSFTPL